MSFSAACAYQPDNHWIDDLRITTGTLASFEAKTAVPIAIALNGVPIYGGSVSGSCDILDVTDADGEWTSFDFCGGHGRCRHRLRDGIGREGCQ